MAEISNRNMERKFSDVTAGRRIILKSGTRKMVRKYVLKPILSDWQTRHRRLRWKRQRWQVQL